MADCASSIGRRAFASVANWLANLAGLLAKHTETKIWIRERALLPTASFPRSDLAVAQLTNRENRNVCSMKKKTSATTNSMNRSFRHCGTVAGFLIAWACCALSSHARAVCQQGCLTNNNTVL